MAGPQLPIPLAHAATFTVTKTADTNDGVCDSDCSLREAIIAANALAGADTITLPAGTYILTIAGTGEDAAATGDLDITGDLTISGAGRASTTIDGAFIDTVVDITSSTATVHISGVTITKGRMWAPPYPSGGINNAGSLTLSQSTVTYNDAQGGGGIINKMGATMTISDSTVSNNIARAGGEAGAGISNQGTLTIISSTISGNTATNIPQGGGNGGGIFNSNSLTIIDSTISHNSATQTGGGIRNLGDMVVQGSTISDNTATQSGGGIWNFSSGSLTIANSTISGNSSGNVGGGIYDAGDSTIANTTISGNTAITDGGGIFLGGLGAFNLQNTIVANNDAGGSPNDCDGSVISLGNNLDSGGSCGLTAPSDLSGVDPLLGPLQDNGGPTFTHALLPGSPAINAGDNATCAAAPVSGVDQRGFVRPMGAFCDMGAFEFSSADLKVVKTDAPDPVEIGEELTYTIVVTNNGPDAAVGVVVTDDLPMPSEEGLPDEVAFVSAVASQGSCSGTTTVTCALGTIANGDSATITIVVSALEVATLSNTASATSYVSDPDETNDSRTATTTAAAPTPTPTPTLVPGVSGLGLSVLGGLLVAVLLWTSTRRRRLAGR